MKNYKEFNFSLYGNISKVSYPSDEMYEVNGTSERFSEGFLTASCFLFSVTLFLNTTMLRYSIRMQIKGSEKRFFKKYMYLYVKLYIYLPLLQQLPAAVADFTAKLQFPPAIYSEVGNAV